MEKEELEKTIQQGIQKGIEEAEKKKKAEQARNQNYGCLGFIVVFIILYLLLDSSGFAEWIMEAFDL